MENTILLCQKLSPRQADVLFPLQVDRIPSGNLLDCSFSERRQQAILAVVASPRFFARLSAGVSQSSA